MSEEIDEHQVRQWYTDAAYVFMWEEELFKQYYEVLAESVKEIIGSYGSPNQYKDKLLSPDIGLLKIVSDGESINTLYIADRRIQKGKSTIYALFKSFYESNVYSGKSFATDMITFDILGNPGKYPDEVVQRFSKRKKLYRSFQTLANKSINRHRSINLRTRMVVLMRDNSTCQLCGRKAPAVEVEVDHILPVAANKDIQNPDDPRLYQVLCKECNIGKSNLTWIGIDR